MFKRLLTLFVVILIVFSFSISVTAESTYKDSVTGVSFTIPKGWNETPLNEEREYIKVKYLPENNDGASIQFGYADMWEEMPDWKGVYSRAIGQLAPELQKKTTARLHGRTDGLLRGLHDCPPRRAE
jgi:hypothetical protein